MKLKVKMRNPQYQRRDRYAKYMYIPEYYEYFGEVVPRPQWLDDSHFCLTTGNKKFAVRILKKEDIVCGWKYE